MTSSSPTSAQASPRPRWRPNLFLKLMAAFFVVLLAMALLTTWLTGRATQAEFSLYTTSLGARQAELLGPLLADYYQNNGSWAGVEQILAGSTVQPRSRSSMGPGMMRPGTMMGSAQMWQMMGLRALVVDESGRVVADSAEGRAATIRGQQLSVADLAQGQPVEVGGTRVGTLLVTDLEQDAGQNERFLRQVNRAILFAVLGATTLALLLAGLIAWRLTRPLRNLTLAAEAIAAGEFQQQVDIPPGDEIGDLAAAFNQMSTRLARAEALRRQLTADVAHELRTPLSVIQGNVEALQDGVFPLTPASLDPIHAKTGLLIRLVEDLRQLALAEADALSLERSRLALPPLVQEVVNEFQAGASEKNITLLVDAPSSLPHVLADRQRLAQVLGNLADNAIRHTPPGGTISVEVALPAHLRAVLPALPAGTLVVVVEDSGGGIPADDLPNVFERFYRADKGRGREPRGGGTGLGLAIARSIVEAHGGKIGAANSPEGGALFWFTLPLAPPGAAGKSAPV